MIFCQWYEKKYKEYFCNDLLSYKSLLSLKNHTKYQKTELILCKNIKNIVKIPQKFFLRKKNLNLKVYETFPSPTTKKNEIKILFS